MTKSSSTLAVDKKLLKMCILTVFLMLVICKTNEAALSLCTSGMNVVISSPCRFIPGQHNYASLDIQSDVFLETSSSNAKHTFLISENFTIRAGAVLSVGYNQELNAGVAPGNSGGSHGGRGGAESGTTLKTDDGVPYGSMVSVNTSGSKGGNGGHGGGHLGIQAFRLIVDGSIYANGEHGHRGRKSGGGSGGGIAILCTYLAGAGKFGVRGGLGRNYGGGGSGGRISINCTNDAFLGSFYGYGGKTGLLIFYCQNCYLM